MHAIIWNLLRNPSKKSAIRSAVMDKLGEVCTVKELPDGLLDARREEVMAQYESYYCSDGSSLKVMWKIQQIRIMMNL